MYMEQSGQNRTPPLTCPWTWCYKGERTCKRYDPTTLSQASKTLHICTPWYALANLHLPNKTYYELIHKITAESGPCASPLSIVIFFAKSVPHSGRLWVQSEMHNLSLFVANARSLVGKMPLTFIHYRYLVRQTFNIHLPDAHKILLTIIEAACLLSQSQKKLWGVWMTLSNSDYWNTKVMVFFERIECFDLWLLPAFFKNP